MIPTVPMTVPESEPVEDKSLVSDITATPEPVAPEKPLTEQAVAGNPQKEPAETLVPENTVTPTMLPQPEQPLSASGGMPSLGTQWAGNFPAEIPTPLPIHNADSKETETAEVITYPAKIFGQVPVINRSDAYVSYFEFAYDLIALAEPKVEQNVNRPEPVIPDTNQTDEKLPPTGDNASPWLSFVFLVLSGVGILGVSIMEHKKVVRKNK